MNLGMTTRTGFRNIETQLASEGVIAFGQAVKHGSTEETAIAMAAAADKVVGIAQFCEFDNEENGHIIATREVQVLRKGNIIMKAKEALTAGDELGLTADGTEVTKAATANSKKINGVAVEGCKAGEEVEVYVDFLSVQPSTT